MKIYLAGRFSRILEFRAYRDQLQAAGFKVTSRWLEEPATQTFETLNHRQKEDYALRDRFDITKCDTFILFSEPKGTKSGHGRLVELGMAILAYKQIIIIGPHDENLFFSYPQVIKGQSWDSAFKYLKETRDALQTA